MGAGKILEEGTDIIAQFAIANSGVAQNISRQNVEVELGRDPELAVIAQNGLHQTRRIDNGITSLGIGQQIDQGDGFGLGACQGAHDKIEIYCGKPRTTIRLNHREPIISTGGAKRQAASAGNDLGCPAKGVWVGSSSPSSTEMSPRYFRLRGAVRKELISADSYCSTLI